jgi:DNA-binding CsgD family transcriptional regulator
MQGEIEKSMVDTSRIRAPMGRMLNRGLNLDKILGLNDEDIDRNLFAAISERNEIGIIVTDRDGFVISCNSSARSILGKSDGLILNSQSLTAANFNERKLLKQAIQQAIISDANGSTEKSSYTVMLVSRQESLPLTVSVIPARLIASPDSRLHEGGESPSAVVLVADPEAPLTESVKRVCELYSLTPAETRLTQLLIDGLTLAEIADLMQLKLATVRVYLKQIFMKTGVHRQPMLIRMLLTTRIPMTIESCPTKDY